MSEKHLSLPETVKTEARPSPVNHVFAFFLLGGVLFAAFSGKMQAVTDASFEAGKAAVNLALGLVGIMALWLGLVRVLEAGGLLRQLADLIQPLMRRLFPDVPAEHPAMSAMMLNMSANMLGLGNAATPMGIRAMVELNRLNPFPGTATNAMCLFLAINTSSVTILPLGVIGVRAAAGAANPASIFLPTLLATIISSVVAIISCFLLAPKNGAGPAESQENEFSEALLVGDDHSRLAGSASAGGRRLAVAVIIVFFVALLRELFWGSKPALDFLLNEFLSHWLLAFLMLSIVSYGLYRGVKLYEAVTDGAKQAFEIAVKIIPNLVAILVVIAMFRASGAMEALASVLEPVTGWIFLPPDVLPLALVRPLSGSGAFGIMSSIVQNAPDSYESFLASIMMGSTETTFYVIAIYFGAIGVNNIRHTLIAALCADVAGIVSSCLLAKVFWSFV
ncbi:MAG: nucleoside recognition domain-containing protein [bacterium]|nr:nucleoside recognition domain-containing protein [bacterium]